MQAKPAHESQQAKNDGCRLGVKDHADAIAHEPPAKAQHEGQQFRQWFDIHGDDEAKE